MLLLGPPGSGKSDLLLRLLARGFDLVADDQVEIELALPGAAVVRPPRALAGLLEARGLGIVRLPHVPQARLALVVRLGEPLCRLPWPERDSVYQVPVVHIDPWAASAPDRVALALDCVLGHTEQVAGAFMA